MTTTEMLPQIFMVLMYLFAAGGMIYMLERREHEYPYDLVIGFFAMGAWFLLAYQWYTGWTDLINGGLVTIVNFYMASWTTMVAVLSLVLWIFRAYQFVVVESREVTV